MSAVVLPFAVFVIAVTLFNLVTYSLRARALRELPGCDAVESLGAIAAWYFLQECLATAIVVLGVPLGWVQENGQRRATRGLAPRLNVSGLPADPLAGRGPVVLVHGWGLNGGCFALLRWRLRRDGWGQVYCFNYRSRNADIAGAALELRQFVEPIALASNLPVTLIGHSLGGLVLRYYVRRYPTPKVRRLLTLGTPHRGTVLARRWLEPLTPESKVLAQLNSGDRVTQQFDVIAISSTFDALVLPPSSAALAGAFNVELTSVGHNALLTSKHVYQLIAENLAAPLR